MTPHMRAALEKTVRHYLTIGLSPFPLPPRQKAPPPPGVTGRNANHYPINKLLPHIWAGGNVGVRPRNDLIGLDIDAYKHPQQAAELIDHPRLDLRNRWRSTSRWRDDPHSGIYWLHLGRPLTPDALAAFTAFAGVDCIVRTGHRYAAVYPSTHPNGAVYQWIPPTAWPNTRGPASATEIPPTW